MPKPFFIWLVLLQAGIALGQINMPMADSGDPVPPEQLPAPQHIEGAGNVRFPITANPKAQAWFEQGYNLLYDFWDYEADRAFEESIRADLATPHNSRESLSARCHSSGSISGCRRER